jgi:hypothetical protein
MDLQSVMYSWRTICDSTAKEKVNGKLILEQIQGSVKELLREFKEELCQKEKLERKVYVTYQGSATKRQNTKCNYCQKAGHLAAYCWIKESDEDHGRSNYGTNGKRKWESSNYEDEQE